MTVPTSVQSLLNDQNIHYDIAATPVDANNNRLWHDQHLRNMGAAKSVILQDAKGRIQVIIAANSLLDLKAVNRHMSRELHATSVSQVEFAAMDDLQIADYLATGEWRGKAGAYAIQGRAAAWIPRLAGSHSGVMGLPMHETACLLRAFGLFD